MVDPIFWLGLSILLVAVSLTAVLVTLLPAVRELARAARSAEKLFDTLNRELPPTLESIRLTGMEITDLKEEVTEGVKSANRIVGQVDQSVTGVKQQAQRAQQATRSLFVGVKTAWKTFTQPEPLRRRSVDQLPPSTSSSIGFEAVDEEMDVSLQYPEEDRFLPDNPPADDAGISHARIYDPNAIQGTRKDWPSGDRYTPTNGEESPKREGSFPEDDHTGQSSPFDESILDQLLTEPTTEPTSPRNNRPNFS